MHYLYSILYISFAKNFRHLYFKKVTFHLYRSSAHIINQFSHLAPHFVTGHYEFPSFFRHNFLVIGVVERMMIDCPFLHVRVLTEFSVWVLVVRIHNPAVCVEVRFSHIVEVHVRRFCKRKRDKYLSFFKSFHF